MTIRKALLVGINAYPNAPLKGCINDVLQMEDLLQRFFGFQAADMHVLLDEAATTAAITAELAWLASGGAEADAVRVFHYSGHGSYVADTNGDEPEGRDECLVPYDYVSAGMMTDDTLKGLYDQFPRTGNLTLVMDCCHSGTNNRAPGDKRFRFLPVSQEEQNRIDVAARRYADDLEAFVVQELTKVRDTQMSEKDLAATVRRLMVKFEKARFGDIRTREANVLLAGCRSDQQAADARIAGGYHGAFTYFLVDAIVKANGQIAYHDAVELAGKSLFAKRYGQVPQLEVRGRRGQKLAFMPFA